MQHLLHEPSWPRFTLSITVAATCLLILLVLNLIGQRGNRIRAAASSDFIIEMLRKEQPDNALVPRKHLSRRQLRLRLFGRMLFGWVMVAITCIAGIEAILAYKTVSNFEDGVLRYRQRHYPEAILAYRMALAADNQSAAVHYYLGVALMADGQPAEAQVSFRSAVLLDPGMEKAYIDYGNVLFQEGRYAGALGAYQSASRLAPRDRLAQTDVAVALQALRRLDEALPLYRSVAEATPNDVSARLNFANCLARLLQYDRADEVYRAILGKWPGSAAAHLAYGLMLDDRGATGPALRQLVMATELNPTDADGQYQYGVVLARHELFSAAADALKRATSLRPSFPPAYYALAEALRGASNTREAAPAYRQYLLLAQKMPQYNQTVGQASAALQKLGSPKGSPK